MFGRVGEAELACLYRALCNYVSSPSSSMWFHAADKSDATYQHAARAAPTTPPGPDRPELNTLFLMGAEVRREILARGAVVPGRWITPDLLRVFEDWPSFCRAVSAALLETGSETSSHSHDRPPSST